MVVGVQTFTAETVLRLKQRTVMKKFLAFLFVTCCFTAAAFAQAQQTPSAAGGLRFEKVPVPGVITSIAQDPSGFMWFGTQDRLYRFDGYEAKTYRNILGDETSLSDDYVESVLVDSKGRIWIGINSGTGGFHRYHPSTETFTRYQNDPEDPTSLSNNTIMVMLEDREGNLWIGTYRGGLNRFDPETETFTRYENIPGDATSLSENEVRAIYEDSAGTLWVGTFSGGLNRFDNETGTFTRYQNVPDDENSLIKDGPVRAIFEDSRGNFWVGTGLNGLHTMDRETGTFTRYPYDAGRPDQPSMPHLRQGPNSLDPGAGPMQGLSFVHEDRHGKLWIGGCGGGLDVYDPDTGLIDHYEANTSDPNSLDNNNIWTIYESRDGTIWIGTWMGLFKAVPSLTGYSFYQQDLSNPDSLSSRNVWAISEGRNGLIYVPTWGGGLNVFDPATGAFSAIHHNPDDPSSLSWDIVIHAIDDQSGTLWVGTFTGGLNRQLDPEAVTFRQYRHDPDDSLSLSINTVWPFEDSRGTIWVLSRGGGLNRLINLEAGTFKRYRYDPYDPTSLSSDDLRYMYEDRRGHLWIGTSGGGLNRYNRDDDTFTRYLPGIHIRSIYEDASGRFWIGTGGDGLILLDRETGDSSRHTADGGLPSNQIAGIVEDDEGILWLSTYEGSYISPDKGYLTRFDPETELFTTFGTDDGLPDIGFFPGSTLKRSDGKMIFGGNGGLITIDPEVFGADVSPTPPTMALTELRIFNERVEPGAESPLSEPAYLTEEIVLRHNQNDFTIDFVGLLYSSPGEISYRYILENHDREWVDARTTRNARYSGLAPGDYVFRVRAISGKGIWSEEDAVVAITILPPWWRTDWAYTLWVLLLVGAVVGTFRMQRARIVRNERERAQIREAELKAESAELRATSAELQARASETQARALAAENERNQLELENAQVIQEKNEQLEQSHTIVAAINAETSFSRLLATILEQCRVIPGVEKASALVYNPDEEAFVFRAASGWNIEEMKPIRLFPDEARARYVEQAEEVAEDIFVARDIIGRPGTKRLAEMGQVASFLVLRIRIGEEVAGYLIFDNIHDQDAFVKRDVILLEGLREHIRSAFIKTRLLEDLQEKNEEVSKTLTDLKNAQRQLIQSEKMASLGELTAGIAHEIKNPLNFVNNFAEVNEELANELKEILDENKDSRVTDIIDDLDEIATGLSLNNKHISKHGKRADSIVNSMMQHAHAESENRYRVEVNRLVDENIGLSYHGMRAQYPDLSVEIEKSFDDSAGSVDMVPQDISRVLINVLNNAFYVVHKKKQSTKGSYEPKVSVTTQQVDGGVEIRIEDYGLGIPEKIKEKIFEPFFTTKPTGSGTGLGLSLAYDIVTQGHGGTMTVESEEGEGATFVITLPGSL